MDFASEALFAKRANMPEEIRDVNTSDSSQEEKVVNEVAPDQQSEQVDQSQEQATSEPQEVKQEVETKPDRPEINYAMEAARKATEALEAVRQLQQSQQQVQQQPEKPKYTKAQLRAFADEATNADNKIWALEEIDKLDKAERQSEIRQMFEGQQRKTQEEVLRGQAAQYVTQNFPECFVRDANGNNIGWDNNSPLAQRIGEYMKYPEFNNNPQGLTIAAKAAAFDLGVSQNRKLANKITATTAQLRKEQKKQLISGTGSSVQAESSSSKMSKVAEEYRKTGNKDAFKQLAKMRGLIPKDI